MIRLTLAKRQSINQLVEIQAGSSAGEVIAEPETFGPHAPPTKGDQMKAKAILLTATLVALTSGVSADTPLVAITSPSGTVYSASFPFTVPISFNVTHHEVKNLNVLDVQV